VWDAASATVIASGAASAAAAGRRGREAGWIQGLRFGDNDGDSLGLVVRCEDQESLLGFEEDGSRRRYMLGHFFMAVDVEHFIPLEQSCRITGRTMRTLQNARKTPGAERVHVAGEREHEAEGIGRERGVLDSANLRRELEATQDEHQIPGFEG